jgi:hypothetical protein
LGDDCSRNGVAGFGACDKQLSLENLFREEGVSFIQLSVLLVPYAAGVPGECEG